MKNNKRFFLLAGVFVLVLVLATVGYRALSRQYKPENGGVTAVPSQEEPAAEPEEAAPAEPEQTENEPTETESEEVEPEEPASGETAPEETEPPEPIMAPDFMVVDGDGNEVYLSDFAGKPVVINIWATWCDPCKWELPGFQEMYEAYGEDMVFMMINTADDFRDSVEGVEAFAEENGYSFPIYYDTADMAAYLYGASSIPLTVFVLPDGTLAGGYRGAIDGDTLEQSIQIVLDLAETSEKVTE